MQTSIVIVSGSIINASTVHLNGIWHLIWRYISKHVLGGHPVLSGHYSIPRGCLLNTGFTVLKCDYYNRGHPGKVDQSDYRKMTIHSEKVLVVNHNYHETKSTTWREINSQTWPFESAEEVLCFLRGPLEWMTEKLKVNVSYIFYLGSQVSAKRDHGSEEIAGRWQNSSLF